MIEDDRVETKKCLIYHIGKYVKTYYKFKQVILRIDDVKYVTGFTGIGDEVYEFWFTIMSGKYKQTQHRWIIEKVLGDKLIRNGTVYDDLSLAVLSL